MRLFFHQRQLLQNNGDPTSLRQTSEQDLPQFHHQYQRKGRGKPVWLALKALACRYVQSQSVLNRMASLKRSSAALPPFNMPSPVQCDQHGHAHIRMCQPSGPGCMLGNTRTQACKRHCHPGEGCIQSLMSIPMLAKEQARTG